MTHATSSILIPLHSKATMWYPQGHVVIFESCETPSGMKGPRTTANADYAIQQSRPMHVVKKKLQMKAIIVCRGVDQINLILLTCNRIFIKFTFLSKVVFFANDCCS